jgi:hypothetical protein
VVSAALLQFLGTHGLDMAMTSPHPTTGHRPAVAIRPIAQSIYGHGIEIP